MINFKNANFVKSASKQDERPTGGFAEILVVGKSNVGKSTLINSITSRKSLAFTSSKPGHTKLLNYFNIDNKFYLVDAPGYGYAKGGVDLDALFGEMMEDYFYDNRYLKAVLILLDSRRDIDESDKELIDFVNDSNIPYYFVITKSDKLNQSAKAATVKRIKEYGFPTDKVLYTSRLDYFFNNLSKLIPTSCF